ncbi:hypothetical protein CYMTET_22785 [Cymbomonas tetramitiformis]|uniref:Uncharacterized protein n=1 Tax=Cymbomonas tetramitiformis TaxID=36881 RepID=A0AAE0L1K2_9CHLO|nr:hypothetical protein CYMTET_22785 [Cymbomonas tetramitiformis]
MEAILNPAVLHTTRIRFIHLNHNDCRFSQTSNFRALPIDLFRQGSVRQKCIDTALQAVQSVRYEGEQLRVQHGQGQQSGEHSSTNTSVAISDLARPMAGEDTKSDPDFAEKELGLRNFFGDRPNSYHLTPDLEDKGYFCVCKAVVELE